MIYVFEDCTLDTARRELRRATSLVAVAPQVFDLLQYLIANRERVVSKEDLIEAIWDGRIVSESTLSSRLTAVRHAIGDCGDAQRLIRTMPRKGFRFVGEVREAGDVLSARTAQVTASATKLLEVDNDAATGVAGQSDPDAVIEERKHVTVLCADVKDWLELIAERDPEQAMRSFDAVLELMMQAVNRYEGTVNVVTGDGITALFGVPVAHEDHAVRACYAALQMQEAVKRYVEAPQRQVEAAIRVRAGLNSGEVVIRSIRSGLRTDCRAMGHTMSTTARLRQIAKPGTLLVSADTLLLVEGHVQVKVQEPSSDNWLGGQVYELVGAGPAQTRFEVLAARGLTGFVGRGAEMEQLALVQARADEGHGQLVTIIGEAGLGKSRLLHEYILSECASRWLVLETASVSYRKTTSFLPVIELLRTYFEIEASDDVREVRDKVVHRLLNLDRALAPYLTALLALLDIPVEEPSWYALEPLQRRQRTLDALKHLILCEARQQPVLLAFEDLHWIDSETRALLEILIDGLSSSRLLLVLTYRPEFEHDWGLRSNYTQLRLNPLPPKATEEFLCSLIGDDLSIVPLKELLASQGNPLFLEESIRTLVEMKVLEGNRGAYRLVGSLPLVTIAPTVQAILAARIDRLAARSKRLLQAASVIGKDVLYAILESIAGLDEDELRRGLSELREAEFIYETSLFPDIAYTFKHALTQEIAYGSLLAEQRRQLHGRIVDVIEQVYPDRQFEHAEHLAHHAVRGALWERAASYLRQAGNKAGWRSALEAREWFEQAIGALRRLPESRLRLEQEFDVHLELRSVESALNEPRRMLEYLREADALAEKLNDDHRRARVWSNMSNAHLMLGELDQACAFGARALTIAQRVGDASLHIVATSLIGLAHYFKSDYVRAVELASDSIARLSTKRVEAVMEKLRGNVSLAITERAWLTMSLAELGRFTEAATCESEMFRLAEASHHPFAVGLAHRSAAIHRTLKGDWAKACSLIEHWLEVVQAGSLAVQLPTAIVSYAWVLAQLGEASQAMDRVREGELLLERQADRGMVIVLGPSYHALGRACLLLGHLDDASRLAARALESSSSQPGFMAHALHLFGDIAMHAERFDPQTGKAYYRKALAIAEPRGMRPLIAHCHRGLSKLYRCIGQRRSSQKHIATATTMYADMGMQFWSENLETDLGGEVLARDA